eukprot:3390563-Alexandrium_andersonii.AAC.1
MRRRLGAPAARPSPPGGRSPTVGSTRALAPMRRLLGASAAHPTPGGRLPSAGSIRASGARRGQLRLRPGVGTSRTAAAGRNASPGAGAAPTAA